MSTIEDVRERIDIVTVVGDYVALRRAGRIHKGQCPFHEERTPSFVVFPESGNWRCFGACAIGGNAFDFIMKIENVDFRGALEILARRVGVALEPPSPAAARRESERERLLAATAAAADYYHAQLLRSPAAAPARDYLRSRGFGIDVAQAFQLGWAPAAGTALVEHLRERGHAEADIVVAGLARPREGGSGAFDLFRGRVMFPIHDARGHAIGFGARTLDPQGIPKYLNSPQSPIFDKSHVLFGLHRAARPIRGGGVAVVVEGYTDVVRAHAAGFENVVASLGTALTEHQVKLLKRFAGVIVLALDADAAGQAATLRGLEVAREAAAGDVVPVPGPTGMVHYEQRLDVDLRVATLPAGLDPDDVIRDQPDTWRAAVAGARPLMTYLFDVLTADLDLREPPGKLKAADRLVPVIAAIPDQIARSAWLARLAALIQVDERDLARRLPSPAGPGGRDRPSPSTPRGAGAGRGRGRFERGSYGGQPGTGTGADARAGAGRGGSRKPLPQAFPALATPAIDRPTVFPAVAPLAGGIAVDWPDRTPDAANESEADAAAHADATAYGDAFDIAPPPEWATEPVPIDLPAAAFVPAAIPDGATQGDPRESGVDAGAMAGRPSVAGVTPAADRQPRDLLTGWILGMLLLDPPRLKPLDSALHKIEQPPLGADDFEHPMERDLVEAIRFASRGAPPPDAPAEQRLDALPDAMAAHAFALRDRAAAEPPVPDAKVIETLRTTVLRLRKRSAERRLPALRYRQADAAQADDLDSVDDLDEAVRALREQVGVLTRLLDPPSDRNGGKADAGGRM